MSVAAPPLEDLTDDEIRRGVNRHYDGGWQQFASDANCEVPASANR